MRLSGEFWESGILSRREGMVIFMMGGIKIKMGLLVFLRGR